VRATASGLRARAIWEPLPREVEQRWRERFGAAVIDESRDALRALVAQVGVALPDCLPILGYGLFTLPKDGTLPAPAAASGTDDFDLPVPALLAKALLAFALHYERRSPIALAVAADVVAVIAPEGTRVADLPRLGGVSREAVAMALSALEKESYATLGRASPGDRLRTISLSERGRAVQHAHQERLAEVEDKWRERFGAATVDRLVDALRPIAGGETAPAPLLEGVRPPAEGWRATQPPIERLPDFPMVLHRGGFPDGA
jgi:DNA-binding MarR family transcriptional regulator